MNDNQLIALAKGGDQKAHATLYTKYGPTLGGVRKHYAATLPYFVYEDLMSHVNEGYLMAVKTYKPDGGAAFKTWLILQCRGAVGRWIRKQCQKSKQHNEEAFSDYTPAPEECPHKLELRLAIDKLPAREREIIELTVIGLTLDEIGKALKISGERVRQIKKGAVARLKKRMK